MAQFKQIQLIVVVLASMIICSCSKTPVVEVKERRCTHEITPENYDVEVPEGCTPIIKKNNFSKVLALKSQAVISQTRDWKINYENILVAALLNKRKEAYCLSVFGSSPSDYLLGQLMKEDRVEACSDSSKFKAIVEVEEMEALSKTKYVVYVSYHCGVGGLCSSSWKYNVEMDAKGKFILVNRQLTLIS